MTTWFLSLLVPVLVGLLWHGFSLKLAFALAGEDAPGFFRAAWVSWLGGLLGFTAATAFSWTVGMMIALFISSTLASLLALFVAFVSTAMIYKAGLRLTMPTALGVTGIHLALSAAVNALLGMLAYSLI